MLTQTTNYQNRRFLNTVRDMHCFRHYCYNEKSVKERPEGNRTASATKKDRQEKSVGCQNITDN